MSSLTISDRAVAPSRDVAPAVGLAPESRQILLQRDLRASLGDGAGYGGMVGFGEIYFSAFALAVGLGELMAGLVASLPLLAGGILQTISPWAIRWLGSHKRWVVCCATLQSLTFFPLMVAAYRGHLSGAGLLAIAALYWAAGLATGPAWNTWIGTIVPASMRAEFFAFRTRSSQAALFLGFLLGGVALQFASAGHYVLSTFAALFAVAGCSRLFSVWMLLRTTEPTPIPGKMRHLTWREMRRQLVAGSGGRLVIYLVCVQAAVQMSGPYFTPFMLEKLHFSYGAYVTLISVAYLAKVLALPAWGRVARHIGAKQLLWIGGIGIIPISGGWIVSHDLSWLILMQVISGAAWGAYELAFFLLFFESIAEEERTSLLTFYNLFYTAAWVSGALMGGLILSACGTSYQGYLLIFGLSSLARLLVLPLLARTQQRNPALPDLHATGTSHRTTEIYFPKEAATSVR
ncbi:MAG: MFS transporter [Pirellulaceae bacterium]